MTKNLKSVIAWLALLLATPLILYVVSYFLLVKRVETVLPSQKKITKRIATSHVVAWQMPTILATWNVFTPIARFDNAYLRPQHWQCYEVNEFPDGRVETNYHLTAWAYAHLSTSLGFTNLSVSVQGTQITVKTTPAPPPKATSNSVPSAPPR